MADRPIIFSAPMVRALLREAKRPGTGKTQTRRVLAQLAGFGAVTEFGPSDTRGYDWHFRDRRKLWNDLRDVEMRKSLPYAVGDRLWVKENHYRTDDGDEEFAVYACDEEAVREHLSSLDDLPAWFSAEVKARHRKLRPSIHMPRWASRLTLSVTDVRVERLNAISREDALAEGCKVVRDHCFVFEGTGYDQGGLCHGSPVTAFSILWDDIHGAGAWNANPWVVAASFEVTLANIDRMPKRPAPVAASHPAE